MRRDILEWLALAFAAACVPFLFMFMACMDPCSISLMLGMMTISLSN